MRLHIVVLVLAAACGAPTPDATAAPDTTTVATVPAFDGRLTVPAGFKVAHYATAVSGVRFMALAPDGAVYATQPDQGRVVRLADANSDGVSEAVTVAASGLKQPHGLAFHKGFLYVASTDGVVRLTLGANGVATGVGTYVNTYPGGGGHWTRTIVFGADSAMYVAVGSTCNLCVEQSEERAAVLRFDEDGSNKRVYASGLRNAVGLAVHPTTGMLWASQNERDNLPGDHEDLPPEELNILVEGGDYGWPYCHSNQVPNPEYNDGPRCARTLGPALAMQAHSAPLGMSFLSRATMFPADYQGDLLVAFHGSWNRSTPTGAKVVRVRVADGKPTSVEDFITGWLPAKGERWGRPVDVLVARDGSVLISDDQAGVIFRVSR